MSQNLRYYKIEIIPDEEQGFTMIIPQLKGCMAFGETIQEAYQMLSEAKELWIETALDKGWSVPEPETDQLREYSGKFNVRLPRYLHRELVELAEKEGTSLNQLVVSFLSAGKERQKSPKKSEAVVWSRQSHNL